MPLDDKFLLACPINNFVSELIISSRPVRKLI